MSKVGDEFIPSPIIAEVNLTPGKSMVAPEAVEYLSFRPDGMFGDRELMWVEGADHVNVNYHRGEQAEPGHFLSLREDAQLSRIYPMVLDGGGVKLCDLDMEIASLKVEPVQDVEAHRTPVSVWGWDGAAIDLGNEAADWGTEIIGRPVRLVAASSEAPRYVENSRMLGRVGFADGYPVSVGSVESFELVNAELHRAGHSMITAHRPRTTILLGGLALPENIPNRDALPEHLFPEDYVDEIQISNTGLTMVLKRIRAVSRCPIPDINEITGVRKGAPVSQALARLGRSGRSTNAAHGTKPHLMWTQYFTVQMPKNMPPGATIDVQRGSLVEVTYTNTANWE
jgi:uncharacterized protein YcbX